MNIVDAHGLQVCFGDIEFVAHCMDQMWQGNRDVNVALEGGRNLKEYALKLINKRRAMP